MSFSTEVTDIVYEGNGVETEFEIPFYFQEDKNISASITDVSVENPVPVSLVLDVDFLVDKDLGRFYLVVPDMDGGGNPILVPRPLMPQERLLIERNTKVVRDTNYSQYTFPAPKVNTEQDRIYQILQELKTGLSRAITLNALTLEDGQTLTGEDILKAIAQLEELIENLDKGSTLPSGGDDGDFLERDGTNLVRWMSGSFSGYSSTLKKMFESTSLHDTVAKILDIQYSPPQVSISVPQAGLKETGTSVSSVSITGTFAKMSEDLDYIEFLRGGTVLENRPLTTNIGSESFTDTTPVSSNTTFSVRVKDVSANPASQANASITFALPYLSISKAAGQTFTRAEADARLVTNQNSIDIEFTVPTTGFVMYMAHDASYPDYNSILDANNFETKDDWTISTKNIQGIDGIARPHKVYEFNNGVLAQTTTYKFRRV